jgi:excisionase family DNA binding protein
MPELLTLDEVADRLRIGKRTVERLVAGGEIRSLRVGRRRLVEQLEVERYVKVAARRGRVA